LIERYSVKEAADIWERQHRYDIMAKIEMALVEAWARMGEVPYDAVDRIRRNMSFTLERVDEIEKVTDHDVVAFVNALGETVGEDSCYIHKGATSSDILDTATSIQIQEAGKLIISEIDKLISIVRKKAEEYKYVPMMGRTHGVHAEPITFGLKLLSWYQELKRDRDRVAQAVETNSVGKMSGAVGTYANLHPDLEMLVCERLGLKPDPLSTQVIARDRHAEYLLALSMLGASLERFALQIRLLQRTETGELEEPFKAGQTGSSAMPHKKNPKTCEQVCGLARLLRGNAMVSLENVALWDERDISHSSVERIILPDTSVLATYLVRRFARIVDGLFVNADRMRKNIEATGGAIYSGRLLVSLMTRGMGRKEAYEIVQRLAIPASKGGTPLREACKADAQVASLLSAAEIDNIFDVGFYLRYVDDIFRRNLEE